MSIFIQQDNIQKNYFKWNKYEQSELQQELGV